MKTVYAGTLAFLICVCAVSADVSLAQVTVPRPSNGRITETTTAKRAVITVTATDTNAKVIPTERFPRSFEFGTDSEPSIRIPIPAVVNRSDNGEAEDVIDVTKTIKIEEKLSPQDGGQVSDLMIESVFFDPGVGQFVLGNIFGTINDRLGIGQEILVPDLFADTTGDGVIGEGDVLYGLVDLNVYLDDVPSFSLGDSFFISAGLVSDLPGMMFSSTPFVFDPDSGFSGMPFTGVGVADAQTGLTAVPELSTWAMMIAGFGLAGAAIRRRRHSRQPIAA